MRLLPVCLTLLAWLHSCTRSPEKHTNVADIDDALASLQRWMKDEADGYDKPIRDAVRDAATKAITSNHLPRYSFEVAAKMLDQVLAENTAVNICCERGTRLRVGTRVGVYHGFLENEIDETVFVHFDGIIKTVDGVERIETIVADVDKVLQPGHFVKFRSWPASLGTHPALSSLQEDEVGLVGRVLGTDSVTRHSKIVFPYQATLEGRGEQLNTFLYLFTNGVVQVTLSEAMLDAWVKNGLVLGVEKHQRAKVKVDRHYADGMQRFWKMVWRDVKLALERGDLLLHAGDVSPLALARNMREEKFVHQFYDGTLEDLGAAVDEVIQMHFERLLETGGDIEN
eukprot:TRINITY_DN23816_c0_g1_i1.p1 TRINITY_DN23816_c0_g1~~TRINITY_DN23816_c0_g1_i1.p1  ORF type:complete len:341 (+),score=34.72 TRINITY_DN23816_c0_g1_i1:138-1160(+)